MTAVRALVGDRVDDQADAPLEVLAAAGSVDDLCRRLHPRLVGALRLYLGDQGLAEELAQDALVRLVEHRGDLASIERPDAWAYRVAFNLARSRLRRLGAERRAVARRGPDPTEATAPDLAAALAVRRALEHLPRRQRQAVVLRFYADLPVAEVAAAMGCRPGTAKAHLHQALAALRLAGLADDDDLTTSEEEDP